MKRLRLSSGIVLAVMLPVGASAQWVQWTGAGANNHYYQLVDNGSSISWDNARLAAMTMVAPSGANAHLATITSAAENDFAFSLLSAANFYSDSFGSNIGPWLGGFQDRNAPDKSEPSGGWRWVTGEVWSYTNWSSGEPNNSGGAEDALHFFGGPSSPFSNWNHWNDITADHPSVLIQYYVVEAVPEPAGMAVLGLGLAWLRRRSRSR